MTDTTPLCRCGHTAQQHQGYEGNGGPQCRACPGDEERTWRHAYTPDNGDRLQPGGGAA